jgi:hypothetical protein
MVFVWVASFRACFSCAPGVSAWLVEDKRRTMKGAGDEQQNGAQSCERSAGSNSTIPSHEFHDDSSEYRVHCIYPPDSPLRWQLSNMLAPRRRSQEVLQEILNVVVSPMTLNGYPCPVLGTLDPALALNTSHRLYSSWSSSLPSGPT